MACREPPRGRAGRPVAPDAGRSRRAGRTAGPGGTPCRAPWRTRRWHDGMMTENAIPAAEQEVVAICRDLIRIDTTNPGDHSGPGERKAAEYVAGLLSEVGVAPAVLESHQKRTSLVARIEGQDQTRPALLIHGHLDVV